MEKTYNFCAGPAVFPEEILKKAQEDLINFAGTGTSILSISHRSKEFIDLANLAKQNLRDLLTIPEDYEILFLHGGASWQAAMIPANFLDKNNKDSFANYVNTGHWSSKAIEEAKFFGNIKTIGSGPEAALNTHWPIDPKAAYCHITPNETIDGFEFYDFPKDSPVPLIADMSSTILSREFDIKNFDLIYAGAQKNMGPSGLSVIILSKNLLKKANKNLPTMMSYQVHVDADSIYNTPATFSWYLMGEFLKWVKDQGGLAEMGRRSLEKSKMLYDFIDNNSFYENKIPQKIRSRMNIPFLINKDLKNYLDLEKLFVSEAKKSNLINLAGHRVTGGMRASLYNAMPLEGVKVLIEFMKDFEKKYG